MSMLEVDKITKVYGSGHTKVVAIEDISFFLDKGQMLAVLGPSGSGKTTLLSVVAGLLSPTSGEILIDNQAIHLHSTSESAAFRRSHVGLVFQDYHLIPFLSALDNLLLVLSLSRFTTRADKQRAQGLLEEFGLSARAKHKPGMLSGGERQRVSIARALMNQPEIMLVDEPTANLDTEHGYKVIDMIRSHIYSRNMTCIMVTHDIRMCTGADKTLKLVDGKVVQN